MSISFSILKGGKKMPENIGITHPFTLQSTDSEKVRCLVHSSKQLTVRRVAKEHILEKDM